MTTQDELARQLIAMVQEATASEAVLLQRRIDAVRGYMAWIAQPNPYTLGHISAFLNGERDDALDYWTERYTTESES